MEVTKMNPKVFEPIDNEEKELMEAVERNEYKVMTGLNADAEKQKAEVAAINTMEEYDFSEGVRGKHYKEYSKGTNMVLLEPEVAKIFKDSESVNHALKMLVELAGSELSRNSK